MVAISLRDSVYFLDFCVANLKFSDMSAELDPGDHVAAHIVSELKKYEHEHLSKFVSVGFPESLMEKCPNLYSRLWAELDVVPIALHAGEGRSKHTSLLKGAAYWDSKSIDEQADSMARKSIMSV